MMKDKVILFGKVACYSKVSICDTQIDAFLSATLACGFPLGEGGHRL